MLSIDPVTKTPAASWVEGPSIPYNMFNYCLLKAVIGGEEEAFLVGGQVDAYRKNQAWRLEDEATSTWTGLATMTEKKNSPGCAVVEWPADGKLKIIVAGGKILEKDIGPLSQKIKTCLICSFKDKIRRS